MIIAEFSNIPKCGRSDKELGLEMVTEIYFMKNFKSHI